MSWKTRYFEKNLLYLLNDELRQAGYVPAQAEFGANISTAYRGEVDTILEKVAEMPERELHLTVGLMREFDR